MPQDPAAALGALLRASSIQDHDEILKAANAAIKQSKNDTLSQHTRVVALLKLDRFDDALRAIDEGGSRLEAICGIEKAYALYKTSRLDDAATIVKSIGLEKRSLAHIAAQVAYRAERFDEARAIYTRLLDNSIADEEHDMNINVKAAEAQAEYQGYFSSNYPHTDNFDSFELCYNVACSYLARGAFPQADDLLQRAAMLCHASDDLNDEDKASEMRPILAQQAFVLARLGKLNEAQDLLNSITDDDSDPDLTLILDTNRSAISPTPQNPYLLQRKATAWEQKSTSAKLFSHQSSLLTRNNFVIDLQAQKVKGVASRTVKMLSKSRHPTNDKAFIALSVLNAAAETHGKTGNALVKALRELSNKRPDDVGLVLTIVQIQLQHGHPIPATATLESFVARLESSTEPDTKDVRFSPGLVALAVSLFRAQGRQSAAKRELVNATKYWQNRPAGFATSLLREAGIELLRSSDRQDLELAGSAFDKLFDGHQGSHIAAAGLVASLATSDPSKIQQHVAELPPVESLIADVNIASLLKAGVATAPKSTTTLKRSGPASDDQKAKKRRKRPLPKNYVEGATPDPERWLPLRDRSSYRPKGKKGKKKAMDSTQGGVVKEEETLELVGGGGVKVEKASAVGGGGKKKKKGKK